MLKKQLREEWCTPIAPVPRFAPEGLVLGAGTVLLPAAGPRRLKNLKGHEPRILALLSAAYDRPVSPSVLGNVERAAKAWGEGDDCLAYVHLAHAGLQPLHDFRSGAYRLFMANCAMMHGASARDVFKALHLDHRYIDAIEKAYNPAQPRVPAGNGRTSGEWTDDENADGNSAAGEAAAEDAVKEQTGGAGASGSTLLSRMPSSPPPVSFLGELTTTQLAELGAYAFRALRVATPAGAAAAVFGLLFIPSPNNLRVEGDVPDIPGLRYSWNRDETQLHFTYDNPAGGQLTFAARLDGKYFRDEKGRIVGVVVQSGNVIIDTGAVSGSLKRDDEPKLCPAPVKDRRTNEKGKDFEIYVKSMINPGNPTPPDMAYELPNPYGGGKPVSFDDCQRTTGMLGEIKDDYEWALKQEEEYPQLLESIKKKFLIQSGRDIDASGGRQVAWFFSQQKMALIARELFDGDRKRQRIIIIDMSRSWRKERQR